MMKLFLTVVFMLSFLGGKAQTRDSLFVVDYDHGWALMHAAKTGETLFTLGRKYHVPPAILADANALNYQAALTPSQKIIIPLGAYNQLTEQPLGADYRAIYYKPAFEDELYKIARNSLVSRKRVMEWNGLEDKELTPGKTLLCGWILYDATNPNVVTSKPKTPLIAPKPPLDYPNPKNPVTQPVNTKVVAPKNFDTVYYYKPPVAAADTIAEGTEPEEIISEAEALYNQQTMGGLNATSEKGTAAFYENNMPVGKYYYAFHSTAATGTIIRVHNPGSGRTIFVKVLGGLPETRLYHNCIIGISGKAKRALGVNMEKAWCELSYAR